MIYNIAYFASQKPTESHFENDSSARKPGLHIWILNFKSLKYLMLKLYNMHPFEIKLSHVHLKWLKIILFKNF